MSRTEAINIGVSQRILWIGGEAYPLQNIARAQTIKLVPKRGSAVASFVKAIVLWGLLGAGGIAALRFAEISGSDVETLTGYVVIGTCVLVGLSAIRLLVALIRPTLYALVIETAGTPRTAVISPDEPLLNQLVRQIMAAINNPRAEFQQRVVNYFGGNHVTQHGDHNIGMVNNNAPADPQAAIRELLTAAHALRGQVAPVDRQVIDESMSTIGTGADVAPQPLRRALGNLAGIATVVGEVGAPVVEAVRKVMAAFGL